MRKLMSLEWRKHRLGGLFKGVLIANLCILGLMVGLLLSAEDGDFSTWTEAMQGLFLFCKATFVVFASVVISRLVIEEYRSQTISLLFMYPIPRRTMMLAKLMIVFIFTFVNILLSELVLGAALAAIIHGTHHFAEPLTGELVRNLLAQAGLNAVYASGIAMIPLFFGMRRKSVPTTIVSSVLIISLTSSGFGSLRLENFASISIALCLAGLFIAWLAIRRVETDDVVG
ncbi:ABC transporter permease [Paenibacillus glufosinatiresistens]|uniref:ABC transporter permease n=1 Tax=Paenibacillus glufosinatiresistens TaxID=3070657 RepID=UPI00286E227C|nr:ABC transporter permease [Paenibacillus sp. YX.27]